MYLMKPGWRTVSMGLVPWDKVNGLDVLKFIEREARRCYQSEPAITEDSAIPFMKRRLNPSNPHIAILDCLHITAEYICDRGISHEWIRHKLTEIFPTGDFIDEPDWTPMSVTQESTRYCNYMKKGGVCFIIPPWVNIREGEYEEKALVEYASSTEREWYNQATRAEQLWFKGALHSEYIYLEEIKEGWTPQMARGDLAIKTKTTFGVTCSLTEWRHIMKQRTADAAHPQMRELMRPQLLEFQQKIPVIFDDISY